MGYNYYGQLGDGTFNTTNRPEESVYPGFRVVSTVAAGYGHSLFLKTDDNFWTMGYNTFGQLGDGTFNNTNQPEQIIPGQITAISAGLAHSLFINRSTEGLWAVGLDNYGQLGDGAFNNTNEPQQIVANNVTAVAAGSNHSLFIKSDGSLWGMGYSYFGQLGDGFSDNGTAIPEQIFPSPQPVLNIALSSKTNLQFKATCGFGGNFRLLGSTNIALPLSQWTPLRTNSVTTRGTNNFSGTLTNAVIPRGQQFYILQSE
jgi:alpha-tubulin suppressor-like RCC1 family protein